MTNIVQIEKKTPRLSAKLRLAIELRVKGGKTIAAACEEAGLSTAGWFKAMKRPAVLDYLRGVQEHFVAEVSASRAVYKAIAFEVALDLMHNAKSEAVRARMAEFLAGDGTAPQVAVHIDARQPSRGYAYVRPDHQIVEIAQDTQTPPEPSEGD